MGADSQNPSKPKDDGLERHMREWKLGLSGSSPNNREAAVSMVNVKKRVSDIFGGGPVAALFNKMVGLFGGGEKLEKPKPPNPEHVKLMADVFTKVGLDSTSPDQMSMDVSAKIDALIDNGTLVIPEDASGARIYEFMQEVESAVHHANGGNAATDFAKHMVAMAKYYDIEINLDAKAGAGNNAGADAKADIAFDHNQEVPITPGQLVDIVRPVTPKYMNAYKMYDKHPVEQGNVLTAEVMEAIKNGGTIKAFVENDPAVNTEGLVGQGPSRDPVFLEIEGADGKTYYTDFASLPGLADKNNEKGQALWNDMKQEPKSVEPESAPTRGMQMQVQSQPAVNNDMALLVAD